MIRKNRLKNFIAVIMSVILITSTEKIVFAATTKSLFGIPIGYGVSNKIVIENSFKNTSNKSAFKDAVDSWNNAFAGYKTRYTISIGTNTNNYATESSQLGNNVNGTYRVITAYKNRVWRKTVSFCILIREDGVITAANDTLYGKRNWRKGTLAHELGHAMSLSDLDDNDINHAKGYGKKSIMSYDRNRKTIITPQTIDVSHVMMFMYK